MRVSATAGLLLSVSTLTLAVPATLDTSLSRKNVYLASCTSRPDGSGCLLGIICSREDTSAAASTLSAVIYYNSPATSVTSSPTAVGAVSSPARAWEGATRRATLTVGAFEGTIDAGAAALSKSAIAGNATLGTEEFICFKDGTATFRFDDGLLLAGRSVDCKADYWCGSVSV